MYHATYATVFKIRSIKVIEKLRQKNIGYMLRFYVNEKKGRRLYAAVLGELQHIVQHYMMRFSKNRSNIYDFYAPVLNQSNK